MLMEDAIALVREHDRLSAELTRNVFVGTPPSSEADALATFERGAALREELHACTKKLLANLTGEDPSEENVEEAIYG